LIFNDIIIHLINQGCALSYGTVDSKEVKIC
jgi:hypothetical protein